MLFKNNASALDVAMVTKGGRKRSKIIFLLLFIISHLRPAGSDPEVVCQKNSFLKVGVYLGGSGPSVAHGKHSVRRRCLQATKNKAESCSLLDAIGRRLCGR